MKRIVAIFLSCVILLGAIFAIVYYFIVASYKLDYLDVSKRYAGIYGLDISLVMAIIKVESNFDKNAISSAGAVGLMQIMPETGLFIARSLSEEFDNKNLLDPETNIKYGCFYLAYLKKKFISLDEIIASYNMGESRLLKLKAEENYDINNLSVKETKNYLKRVKNSIKIYKKLIP